MERVLITGASGYLGKLAAAALLAATDAELLLPVRATPAPRDIEEQVLDELPSLGVVPSEAHRRRIRALPYHDDGTPQALTRALDALMASEVIHCAGCLDYFNDSELQAANVELTGALLRWAERSGVGRFIYVSTAFSSGYLGAPVPEALHAEPGRDPTAYTRTKRAAERLVAQAALPWLILRPSIVIGHSQSGRYVGRQYGLYQLWNGIERLLCNSWEREFHAVAPNAPLHVLHQDAFQQALLAARERAAEGSIINVVSRQATCPQQRELWDLWIDKLFRPERRFYYDSVDAVPVGAIPRRQRALLALASVNLEIAAHDWRFETGGLDKLGLGPAFPHATLASVRRCHDVFFQSSDKVQRFQRLVAQRFHAGHPAGDRGAAQPLGATP